MNDIDPEAVARWVLTCVMEDEPGMCQELLAKCELPDLFKIGQWFDHAFTQVRYQQKQQVLVAMERTAGD